MKKSEIINELNIVKIFIKVDGVGFIEGYIDEIDKKEGI